MGRSWETAVRDSNARYMKKKHAWSATPRSTHGFDAALQTMGGRRPAAASVTSPTDRMPLESMTCPAPLMTTAITTRTNVFSIGPSIVSQRLGDGRQDRLLDGVVGRRERLVVVDEEDAFAPEQHPLDADRGLPRADALDDDPEAVSRALGVDPVVLAVALARVGGDPTDVPVGLVDVPAELPEHGQGHRPQAVGRGGKRPGDRIAGAGGRASRHHDERGRQDLSPHSTLPARNPRPPGRGGAPISMVVSPQSELSTRSASGPGENQAVGPLGQPSQRRWGWTGRRPRREAGRRTVNLEPQGQALGLKHGLLSLKAPDFSPGDVYFSTPSVRVSTRSASCVGSGRWPTTTTAPPDRARRRSASRIAPACSASRLPVGSSASKRGGSLSMARQYATRCCSPPESWGG